MKTLILAFLLAISACYANTVNIQLTGLPTTHQDGTYNGYVTATIDGATGQFLICDDYEHETVAPSDSLVYDYSFLTSSNPLEYARFTQGNSALDLTETETYEVAAVLLTEFQGLTNHSDNTITDYQYALWNLFDPYSSSNPTGASANSNEQTLQTNAIALVKTGAPSTIADYSNLVIYTPTRSYAENQEFLGLSTVTTTNVVSPAPEPATLSLAAAAGLVAWAWKRRKAAR